MPDPKPIRDDIGSFVSYDPDTGVLTWRVDMGRQLVGSVAGRPVTGGYLQFLVDGQNYLVHRVAWFLSKGEQPPSRLDHRDTDPSNNRIGNLRPATPTENNANWKAKRDGLKGVTLRSGGRYQAQIKCRGKNYYLGLFDTEEMASAAYVAKAQELFGEFARAA